jgi:clan AA aspartic protease
MSVITTEITLKNGADVIDAMRGRIKEDEIRQMTVDSIVDTGAWTMVINEEIRTKLGLLDRGFGEANLADGKEEVVPMAGPVEVWWKNRRFTGDALVLPNAKDILLGAIPLEEMDLTINPKRELVGVHGDRVIHRV